MYALKFQIILCYVNFIVHYVIVIENNCGACAYSISGFYQ